MIHTTEGRAVSSPEKGIVKMLNPWVGVPPNASLEKVLERQQIAGKGGTKRHSFEGDDAWAVRTLDLDVDFAVSLDLNRVFPSPDEVSRTGKPRWALEATEIIANVNCGG
jgi:hypothetical protein